jgi:hypothetical protein
MLLPGYIGLPSGDTKFSFQRSGSSHDLVLWLRGEVNTSCELGYFDPLLEASLLGFSQSGDRLAVDMQPG